MEPIRKYQLVCADGVTTFRPPFYFANTRVAYHITRSVARALAHCVHQVERECPHRYPILLDNHSNRFEVGLGDETSWSVYFEEVEGIVDGSLPVWQKVTPNRVINVSYIIANMCLRSAVILRQSAEGGKTARACED